jgi:MbtH protein
MSEKDTDSDRIYRVVINHEEQYSIWPDFKSIPEGWRDVGFKGAKDACLEHIRGVWTDMRPLSLRRAMDDVAS